MDETTGTAPEAIKADVKIGPDLRTVNLVRVAADEDAARPWRVEEPGATYDGWYMAAAELRHVQRAA